MSWPPCKFIDDFVLLANLVKVGDESVLECYVLPTVAALMFAAVILVFVFVGVEL